MNKEQAGVEQVRTAKRFHRAGVEALGRNSWEDAVRALRISVELDPDLGVAWNDLGVVMEALGNASEAARCYRLAVAVGAAASEARTNLAMLQLQMEISRMERNQALTSSVAPWRPAAPAARACQKRR